MNLLNKYQPDKQIENYAFSLSACIGRGSSGTVYIGRNQVSNEVVAIKAIDMRSLKTDYAWKMLCSEVKIMKKLKHPHVVRLLDVFQTKNNTYIITEFCDQGDLRSYLKKKQFLSEDESIAVCSQIISGLHELAAHGIIHRDLKPANILVSNGTFKITDFGFAKKLDSLDDQLMDSLVGTPLYMAPQILHKQQYTSKCDVWSLGLIVFELVYSKTPWPAVNVVDLVHKMNTMPLTFPKDPFISEELKGFLQKCICFAETERMSIQDLCSHPLFERYVKQVLQKILNNSDSVLPEPEQEFQNSQPSSLKDLSQKKNHIYNFESTPIPSQLKQHLQQHQYSIIKQQSLNSTSSSPLYQDQSPIRNTHNQINSQGNMSPFQQQAPQLFVNTSKINSNNKDNLSKISITKRDISTEEISPLKPQLQRVFTSEEEVTSNLSPLLEKKTIKQSEQTSIESNNNNQFQPQEQFSYFQMPSPYTPISPMSLEQPQINPSYSNKKSNTLPEQQLISLIPKYSAPDETQNEETHGSNPFVQQKNLSGNFKRESDLRSQQQSITSEIDTGQGNHFVQTNQNPSVLEKPTNSSSSPPIKTQGSINPSDQDNQSQLKKNNLLGTQKDSLLSSPRQGKPIQNEVNLSQEFFSSPNQAIPRTVHLQNQQNGILFREGGDDKQLSQEKQDFTSQNNKIDVENDLLQYNDSNKNTFLKNASNQFNYSARDQILLDQYQQGIIEKNNNLQIENNQESPRFQRQTEEIPEKQQQHQISPNLQNPDNSSFIPSSKNNGDSPASRKHKSSSSIHSNGLLSTKSGSVNPNQSQHLDEKAAQQTESFPISIKSPQGQQHPSNSLSRIVTAFQSPRKEFESITPQQIVVNNDKKTISWLDNTSESNNSSNKRFSLTLTPLTNLNSFLKNQNTRNTSPSKPPIINISKRQSEGSPMNPQRQASPIKKNELSVIHPININNHSNTNNNIIQPKTNPLLNIRKWSDNSHKEETPPKRNPLNQNYPSNIPNNRSHSLQSQLSRNNFHFQKPSFPSKITKQFTSGQIINNEAKFSVSDTKRHIHTNINNNYEPHFFNNSSITRQPRSTSFKEEKQWVSFTSETPLNLPSSNIQSPLKTKHCFKGSTISPLSGITYGSSQLQDFSVQEMAIELMIQLIRTMRQLRNQVESISNYTLKLDSPLLIDKLGFLLNRFIVIQSSMLKIQIFDKGINVIHLDRWVEFKNSEKWPCLYQRVMADYLEITRVASINEQKSRELLSFHEEAKKDFNFGKLWRQTHAQAAAGEEDNTNFYFYVYQLLKQAIKQIYWKLESSLSNSAPHLFNSDDAFMLSCLSNLVDFHQLLKLIISKKEDFSAILSTPSLQEILKEKSPSLEYFSILKQRMCLYDLIQQQEPALSIINAPTSQNKPPIIY